MGRKDRALRDLGIGASSIVKELSKPAAKPLAANRPSWNKANVFEHQYHQADLLFLPKDRGYRYALVVVDIKTRKLCARPLKKKDGKEVLVQLKSIYGKGKGTFPKPHFFHMDAGTEFAESKVWLKKNKVAYRVAATNRHSQMALVEAANKVLGGVILGLQLNEELRTKEV
eukprot:g3713.t1